MSLKTYINKKKSQNLGSSQSSAAALTSLQSNCFTAKGQMVSQNSQNSQNTIQMQCNTQTQQILSQASQFPVPKNSSLMIEEPNIFGQTGYSSFKNKNLNSTQNTSFLNQLSQDEANDSYNQILHENNFIQNPNLNQSFLNQSYQLLSQHNLKQSQLFLPAIQESKVSQFDGKSSQIFNPSESRLNHPNLIQSSLMVGQISQQQQLANISLQLLQDEILKQKIEQRERELILKQELLQEMRDLKHFFQSNVIKQIEDKNEQMQGECQKSIEEVQKKVENVVKTIFDYIKDEKQEEKKKNSVAQSDYAQDISDLYNTVNSIKGKLDKEGLNQQFQQDLNKAIKIIFSKINSAKRSVKKQIVQTNMSLRNKRKKATQTQNN
ncbi:hypothetical protein TTHERM_00133730 (macronuclear) [Tetrahymena thermophila SB210]|uniref:Uncharacterized protein n=1 Tax=Tetrahymena thermophila (strain SB210) TaxID=312017 RepID=I7M265_TETTS|nr:hypothetical protein TTHERM_00133730 [Tetrahymena thermophila SB210]EAR99407.3 hypothetical protein TTHERM_00133730 [Tetrahymena thermophila SB210]|eukprot:XP_001019652.3 hypothetical protein TTHERM_00133730 [Tetrahymena thermophila SB210]